MEPMWFHDTRRRVLHVTGPDRDDFLQGIVTSDIGRLTSAMAVYAALLTPQGKYLADFVLMRAIDSSIRVDIPRDLADSTRRRLLMYRLRRDVEIEETGETVACLFGEGAPESVGLASDPGSAAERDGLLLCVDPRQAGLGVRICGTDAAAFAGSLGAREAPLDAWERLRIGLGVPEGGLDLLPEEVYPLEAGLERLNGVDFRKGCYVGQEVTARMRHKTTLRKGIVRVRLAGPAPARGTPVLADDRPAGTMLSTAGAEGLAQLRLDRVAGASAVRAGEARLSVLE